MPQPSAHDRFIALLHTAVQEDTLVKLTLGKYRGSDATLKNVFIRPVRLKVGPHFAFVWRHATRDVTKNLSPEETLQQVAALVGHDFLDAHLFTATDNAQFESKPEGDARLRVTKNSGAISLAPATHNRTKSHLIPVNAPWLRTLGVVNERGHPREGMADKFRQIQKFAELLSHLLDETFPPPAAAAVTSAPDAADAPVAVAAPIVPSAAPAATLQVVDMGSGKGYLTFALAGILGDRAAIHGVEVRPELVDLCNRAARDHGFASRLTFTAGTITTAPVAACDVLIALHACDTATDDALARGIAANARLLVVAPCCQKELRSQLTPPPVLAGALRHGIFQERQAEFVTDALRAQLLEWAGYRTKVFEFISTDHTAKNLMIAAIKSHAPGDALRASRVREFAAFYGIRTQRLAGHLGIPLAS